MFNKLKCLFSFNWFYIILFIVLSLFNFWDEINVGRETFKIIIEERKYIEQKRLILLMWIKLHTMMT